MTQNVAWVDVETTSSMITDDPHRQILEIAAIITDAELNELAMFEAVAVQASERTLRLMSSDAREMHEQTGLIQRVRSSRVSLAEVDERFAQFLNSQGMYTDVVLGGNSVFFDAAAIRKDLPVTAQKLHYHVLDVSSVREAFKRLRPSVASHRPRKRSLHTAMDDIRESLEEMRFYQDFIA